MKTKTFLSKNNKPSRKVLIIVGTILILAGFGGWWYINNTKSDPVATAPNPTTEPINYAGPTEQEKAQSEQFKDEAVKRQQTQSSSGSVAASPAIASYGQNPRTNDVEVGAFVQGVYEDGGKCTLTLEKNGISLTTTRTASKNATTTNCGVLIIERSKLSAGSWKATVAYSSPTASGTSSSVIIEVK